LAERRTNHGPNTKLYLIRRGCQPTA